MTMTSSSTFEPPPSPSDMLLRMALPVLPLFSSVTSTLPTTR